MAVISGGSFAKDLLPFVGKWFGDEHKDYDPLYPKIFEVVQAKARFHDEPMVPGFGLPVQKAEGASVTYDSTQQGYNKRYSIIDYALGFIITRNMLDDGLALVNGERFSKKLKQSMVKGRESVCAAVLNRAFNSSYTGGDGKELCATDHTSQAGDLKNEPTTASDLDENALEQAYIDIVNMKDDRGLRIKVMPKKLIVPADLAMEAERLLKSEHRVGVANNDINAVKSIGLIPEGYMMHPYLTDADAWFILTDQQDGLKFLNRRDIDLTTDNDFDTENAKFKSVMRFDVGWTDFRAIYGSPGA